MVAILRLPWYAVVLALFPALATTSTNLPLTTPSPTQLLKLQFTHPLTGTPVAPLTPDTHGLIQAAIQHVGKQQTFGFLPCTCEDASCGCCAGMQLTYFNWSRTACVYLTYDPYEFSIEMKMLMDDEVMFSRSVSGRNPPPVCLPAPMPPLMPSIDMCVKAFNIFTPPPGINLHMCVNLEARVARAPVFVLEFDCMRMGTEGVFMLKPEDNGEVPDTPSPGENTTEQQGPDDYDEVTEDRVRARLLPMQ